MYGCSRAPSLLPKYAIDYVVHKEAVRQVFLDGVGSFLFEHKKATCPPLPFKLGSYKVTRVKKVDEFVEELGKFHFGEINSTGTIPRIRWWSTARRQMYILSTPATGIKMSLFFVVKKT